MLPVLKIINRVLVKTFYERHAGLLFFVFYIMFGMVESGQIISYHLGLIYGAIGSPVFMGIILAIWFLYLAKGTLFFEECFGKPQNNFLHQISLLDRKNQFLWISTAFVLIYLPVLSYSAVMIVVAFKNQNIWPAFSMIFFHITALSLSAYRIVYKINSSIPSIFLLPAIRFPFIKTFPLFYIGLLMDRFKIMLLLTKIFSIACIIGFLQIPLDDYEPRLAYLGLVIGIMSHSAIIFEWRKFEDHYLFFTRTLPLTLNYRFAVLTAAYAILLIPEFVVLVVQHVHIWNAIIAIYLGISFSLFAHGSLFKNVLDNDRHIQTILWLFLITFFLTLSKLALPTAIFLTAIGWWRFRKYFESYEPSANISG
jgi:hypothetical protein